MPITPEQDPNTFSRRQFLLGTVGVLTLPELLTQKSPRSATRPQIYLVDQNRLTISKSQVQIGDSKYLPNYQKLIWEAQFLLSQKPPSVMDKEQIPPSSDKHDYLSLAPYYWPDPTKPDGLPYISKDGQINPEANAIPDRDNLFRMIGAVNTLAFAHYYSGNSSYGAKAAEYLRTWFINPDTRMNPNLNFTQGIKGRNNGVAAGIIDTYKLPWVIEAAGLLESSRAISSSDKKSLAIWFRDYSSWLLNSDLGKSASNIQNNIGTWYDVQTSTFSLYAGVPEQARTILEEAKTKRIASQIEPDGRQPQEIVRSNSWDYSLYNIRALSTLACLGNLVGINLTSYSTFDGRSISKAIEFLEPYGTGQRTWEFPQLSAPPNLDLYSHPTQRTKTFAELMHSFSTHQLASSGSIFNLLYPVPS